MDDEEREALLARVNHQGATDGASMPDSVTIDGADVDLGEFVVETRGLDRLPPDAEETLEAAKRRLRTERARRYERLESIPFERDAAEELADEITGIGRALNALENIRQPDYADRDRTASIEDHERWLSFLGDIS